MAPSNCHESTGPRHYSPAVGSVPTIRRRCGHQRERHCRARGCPANPRSRTPLGAASKTGPVLPTSRGEWSSTQSSAASDVAPSPAAARAPNAGRDFHRPCGLVTGRTRDRQKDRHRYGGHGPAEPLVDVWGTTPNGRPAGPSLPRHRFGHVPPHGPRRLETERRHDRRAAHGAVRRDVDDPRVRRGDRVLERLASHPAERRRPCPGANPRMPAGCVLTKVVERPMHPCHCLRSPPLTYPRSSSVVSPCHIGRGPSRPVSPERTTRHRPISLRADS